MSGRIRACSCHERTALSDGWELARTEPRHHESPHDAGSAHAAAGWRPAQVPGTAASALRSLGAWSFDREACDFDADDWWYRLRFDVAPPTGDERLILGFDGLATLAEVWLNGVALFESANMFVAHECDVTGLLAGTNELTIRCRSVAAELKRKRPRARWRTPMVADQQLRWIRTTLLGRTPGWSPPAAPVGPWRPVWLERRRLVAVDAARVRTHVLENRGIVAFSCKFAPIGAVVVDSARLVAERDGARWESTLVVQPGAGIVDGRLAIPNARLWWPHTHGEPALYRLRLVIAATPRSAGTAVEITIDLGNVGFRELSLDRQDGDFALSVNGRAVFCRGACWTPTDCVSLQSSADEYRREIARVREAGMNMLRVAGPLVYESEEFLDACDAGGILLWQDFMFANMDYPGEDEGFRASVDGEARQQLLRMQARPSLAILCGNSEGGQQAAMSGAPRDLWTAPLFESHLAAVSEEICPDVPYCPSSTHGGAFPHQSSAGAASYYGVGAYMLPLTDARRANVRFASECLAFANVPEEETLALLTPGQAVRCHHPRWKERVPRDRGAGWDFDDVRDHYLRQLFRLDPMALRYAEHDRYLRLSRAVSGEVMAACFAEWRGARSGCRGALIWFLRDLWPGAGWGIVDSTGSAKAAYYHLKRVLQPLFLGISDEGTNGLTIHVLNEADRSRTARLELRLFRHSEPVGPPAGRDLQLAPATATVLSAIDLYEHFLDLSCVYRFGAPAFDLLHARLMGTEHDAPLAEAFHFPLGAPNDVDGDIGLAAAATPRADGGFDVRIQCRGFAQSVHLETPGFAADDQYFHIAPRSGRSVALRPRVAGTRPRLEGHVHATNSSRIARIAVES